MSARRAIASRVSERFGGGDLGAESAWSFALELTTLLGSVMSYTMLGRTLGPEGYGGYASLYALIGPFVTLAASGSTLSLLQHTLREREPLAEASRSCLSISLLLGLLLVPITAVAAAHFVSSLTGLAIVSLLITEFITNPVVQIAATTVQAGKGLVSAVKLRLVMVVLRALLLAGLYVTGHLTVASLGVASVGLTAVVGAVALARVGGRFSFPYVPGKMRWIHLRTNVMYSVGISAFSFQNDGDKTVLAANRFTVDTGLYAAAYRIAMLGMLPMSSVVSATHQRFLHHEEGLKGQHLKRAISFTVVTAAYGAVFIVGVLIFAPLLPLIVGDSFKGSIGMLRWLSPLVLLRTLSIFPINGLMGLGKMFLRTTLIVCNATVSMALYIVLIPGHGWRGAVAGTLISEVLLVGTTWTALVVMQRRADRAIDGAARSVVPNPEAGSTQHAADSPQ